MYKNKFKISLFTGAYIIYQCIRVVRQMHTYSAEFLGGNMYYTVCMVHLHLKL